MNTVPLSSQATLPQKLSLLVTGASTGFTLMVALRNRMDELGDGERDSRGELLSSRVSLSRPDLSSELVDGDSRGVWRVCVGEDDAIAELCTAGGQDHE